RSAVEGWMLWNLTLALRDHNQDRESYEVSLHALKLPPDGLTQSHALIVAYEDLMNGAPSNAFQLIDDIHEPSLRDWDRLLWRMVCTLRDFRRDSSVNGPAHDEAVNRLFVLASETGYLDKDELLLRMHRDAVMRVAQEKGSLLFSLVTRIRL